MIKYTEQLPVRWGIIGCGNVTEKKSGPAYQKVEDFELKAVMRRNSDLAKDYAERHGIDDYYDDANKIIFNDIIDAVYIATPPDSHKTYALKVAEAGKPCCIEKPMAVNYRECREIYQAFEAKGIPLFVAYYRRSLPRFLKVKELLDSNAIGKIRHINWQLNKPPRPEDLNDNYVWRTDKKIALGGYFDDLASHGLDLFAYLLGDFKEAKGVSLNQQGLYTAFDSIAGCWQHSNGITGTGNWNFGCRSLTDKIVIYGSKGELTFSMFEHEPVEISSAEMNEKFDVDHPENIQYYHVRNMRDHLLGNSSHPSTGKSGLHTAWVMDKILGRI